MSLVFQPVLLRAESDSTEQEARRDLTNYASIVVGYDLDERCQVLNTRQRSDYFLHMKVIRLGFEKKGLPSILLDQIEDNARSAGRHQFSACDRDTAELIERLGAFTASLGEDMANWISRKKNKSPKR